MQRTLRHRVALKLVSEVRENRTAERQVTQVISKCRESCERLTAHAEGRNAVRDRLLGVGDYLENRAAQRLKRVALRLLDAPQVLINLLDGHTRESRPPRREPSHRPPLSNTSPIVAALPSKGKTCA